MTWPSPVSLAGPVIKPALAVCAPRHSSVLRAPVPVERFERERIAYPVLRVAAALESRMLAVQQLASASPRLAVIAWTAQDLEAVWVAIAAQPEIEAVAAHAPMAIQLLSVFRAVAVDVIDAEIFSRAAACALAITVMIPDFLLDLPLVAPLSGTAGFRLHTTNCPTVQHDW